LLDTRKGEIRTYPQIISPFPIFRKQMIEAASWSSAR
jgi:hypothetical protein